MADLLEENNPEREYCFLDRNYTEEYTAEEFRQILTEALRFQPDINTAYYDKEDALLLAVNFKNPPGRLLRRQWSYPIKSLPDFAVWRKYAKGEQMQIQEPCYDIPTHKVGLLRINHKTCFPCDNSVIRIDKINCAARRVGLSVINKDNLTFGIKETEQTIEDKSEF